MPMYCYKGDKGTVMERRFKMGFAPIEFTASGEHFRRDFVAEHKAVPATKGWPMECYASGVNAEDAGKLRQHFRDIGVPTEVSNDGNPIYRDARHRRRALKARGFMDKSSFF